MRKLVVFLVVAPFAVNSFHLPRRTASVSTTRLFYELTSWSTAQEMPADNNYFMEARNGNDGSQRLTRYRRGGREPPMDNRPQYPPPRRGGDLDGYADEMYDDYPYLKRGGNYNDGIINRIRDNPLGGDRRRMSMDSRFDDGEDDYYERGYEEALRERREQRFNGDRDDPYDYEEDDRWESERNFGDRNFDVEAMSPREDSTRYSRGRFDRGREDMRQDYRKDSYDYEDEDGMWGPASGRDRFERGVTPMSDDNFKRKRNGSLNNPESQRFQESDRKGGLWESSMGKLFNGNGSLRSNSNLNNYRGRSGKNSGMDGLMRGQERVLRAILYNTLQCLENDPYSRDALGLDRTTRRNALRFDQPFSQSQSTSDYGNESQIEIAILGNRGRRGLLQIDATGNQINDLMLVMDDGQRIQVNVPFRSGRFGSSTGGNSNYNGMGNNYGGYNNNNNNNNNRRINSIGQRPPATNGVPGGQPYQEPSMVGYNNNNNAFSQQPIGDSMNAPGAFNNNYNNGPGMMGGPNSYQDNGSMMGSQSTMGGATSFGQPGGASGGPGGFGNASPGMGAGGFNNNNMGTGGVNSNMGVGAMASSPGGFGNSASPAAGGFNNNMGAGAMASSPGGFGNSASPGAALGGFNNNMGAGTMASSPVGGFANPASPGSAAGGFNNNMGVGAAASSPGGFPNAASPATGGFGNNDMGVGGMASGPGNTAAGQSFGGPGATPGGSAFSQNMQGSTSFGGATSFSQNGVGNTMNQPVGAYQ